MIRPSLHITHHRRFQKNPIRYSHFPKEYPNFAPVTYLVGVTACFPFVRVSHCIQNSCCTSANVLESRKKEKHEQWRRRDTVRVPSGFFGVVGEGGEGWTGRCGGEILTVELESFLRVGKCSRVLKIDTPSCVVRGCVDTVLQAHLHLWPSKTACKRDGHASYLHIYPLSGVTPCHAKVFQDLPLYRLL